MNARTLLAVFDSIYILALTSWVGSILFFSFGVAPIIFRVLSPESASKFVRALFPHYYAWGATSCGIALPALICGALSYPELRGPMVGVQAGLILASLLVMLYCGNSLTQAINHARDAGPEMVERFNRLHKRSVTLNTVALVVGLGLLIGFATRRPVRTIGLQEMTPQERARYDLEFSRAFDEILNRQPDRFRFDDAARKELEELVEAKRKKARSVSP